MANHLTGDYDAVIQLSPRLIDGLLATLHQNAAEENAPLKLPHSVILRVGDPPALVRLDSLGAITQWLRENRMAGRGVDRQRLRDELASMAPPGARTRLEDELSLLGRGQKPTPPPDAVRGTVKLQVSAPTVSLTADSTSEVTVHADVRAHYYPDPGAGSLASSEHPLHGAVDAVFELRTTSAAGSRKLSVRPSAHDDKIQFRAAPGTNLTASEVARISTQVRATVRESFTPLPVDLPPDFPFSAFKALGAGAEQALALPIRLDGGAPSADHIQSVSHAFIGAGGFAVAVSKEYVQGVLRTISNLMKSSIESGKRWVNRDLDVYYTGQVTAGPSWSWTTGSIKVSLSARLVGHNSPFTFHVDIEQTLTLTLNASTQTVAVKADGDPVVHGDIITELVDLLGGGIRSSIKAARDEALPSVNEMVQGAFLAARNRIVQGARSFDPAATVSFTAVAISAHGLIVRGELGSGPRHAPVVHVAETDEGQAFTALRSWIPGGRIDRLRWSWVEHPGRTKTHIWAGVTKTLVDTRHRFILPKPVGVTELGSICLRIEGTQTAPDGSAVAVTSGGACHVRSSFGPILEVPSWWEAVVVPMWLPDSLADGTLREAIAGHVTVQGGAPRKNELTHNSLVYFPDWRADQPLAPLERALSAMARKKVSLVLIVVLPPGAFDRPRREVEAKLHRILDRTPVQLMLTEDDDGGWARTFAASRTPSAYLVDARRRFVWKQEGTSDAEALAAALDRHVLPAPAPRARPLRLTVSPGDRAPDISFEDDRGQGFALHRMRGREVLLSFWQSWSAPCLKELRRLQELEARGKERGPLIVAFHGGRERGALDAVRERLGLRFPLVQDTDQRIARLYGVRCWPTTVSIDPHGRLGHVQFGLEHGWRGGDSAPGSDVS